MQIDEHVLLHGFVKAKASSGLIDIGDICKNNNIYFVRENFGVSRELLICSVFSFMKMTKRRWPLLSVA